VAFRARRPRFRGPAADSELGGAPLDSISVVAAVVGFAAAVSQSMQLCGVTSCSVQSLRMQCGARKVRARRCARTSCFVERTKLPRARRC
jgi:hypothetical protein